MTDRTQVRPKQITANMQQVVTQVDVYSRPLNSSGGKSGAISKLCHEGVVATTYKGQLHLIEKGVPINDDINYQIRYREGGRRIVQVTEKEICNWIVARSVKEVKPGLTLEDLFDACGEDYNMIADNCWNGTHRMRAAANEAEDGLPWQWKLAIGLVVIVAAAGAVWIGHRMICGRGNKGGGNKGGGNKGGGNKMIQRKKAQKQ